MYTVFTRNWWKIENGKKVPAPRARKTILTHVHGIEEAREICKEWNDNNIAGVLSRKAEFSNSL